METFPRRRPAPRPFPVRRALAVVAALSCGGVAYVIYGAAVQGHSLDDRVRELGGQNAALRHQIDDRRREISEAQSPAWLEGEARKLDYVLPGERTYVFPSPGAPPAPGGGVEVKQLPVFPPPPSPSPPAPGAPPAPAPAPTPTAAAPTPAPPAEPAIPAAEASPTPYTFSLPPPSR